MDRPSDHQAITTFTLPNGLRAVHRHADGAVEYCGYAIKAGSRNDPPSLPGLAHFVEHTIFKGTAKRRAWHIINRMEAIGGELNAYTTKEETMVYSIFPAGYVDRAVELLTDLTTSSIFPQAEIDREREVVCDEINSYLDTPSEAVFDEFEEEIFKGTPLAHNILGTVDSVESITPADCRTYLLGNYRTDRMVFFYMGPSSPRQVERALTKVASSLTATPSGCSAGAERITPASPTFNITRNIDSHQSHTVMGALIPGMHEADRYAYSLLTNILGGPGMNSLLNLSLRERRGLVYTVDASTALMTDTGLFTVYYGCDPADSNRCSRLVNAEVTRLAENMLTERALDKAKKQYLGQLMVASDNREQLALSTARAILCFGRVASSDEIQQRILAVTPQNILEAAQSLLPLNSLTLT